MPLLKKGAKTIGREVIKTGLDIAGDVVQGRNIKQAAQSRLKST
jgi:energy-converting hydrogenase Eha subunit B